ncbi:VTC domain-containing protein [Novipirellula caenicola]|uniref:VTC domain-containing protein n=1 Tax=Novipirellula caenicola TaxID=1536901 RepID=UPI0031F1B013
MKFLPRYECTFVLDDIAATALIESASRRMDPPASNDVSDLFYDTENWHRPAKTKAIDKTIYRVRRIDHAWDVFLEQQRREKQTSKLRRSIVPSSELKRLEMDEVDKTWEAAWFHKNILKHGLRRSLKVRFDRLAFDADSIEGPLRLTIDQNIRCQVFSDLVNPNQNPSTPIPMHLVRMKYFVSLPAIFKSLIYEFALLPNPTSMYRECVLCCPVDQCAAMCRSLHSTEHKVAEPKVTAPKVTKTQLTAPQLTETASTVEVATCQFG